MKKKIFIIFIFLIIAAAGTAYFMVWAKGRSVSIDGISNSAKDIGQTYNSLAPLAEPIKISQESLTGDFCPDGINKEGQLLRPVGVMLAADGSTRPLSGIAQADVVIEMPVIVGGINRFLAIFQCTNSDEIGSIRSARDDFIPLAAGFDAIYGHWGGSHFALDELKKKVADNIDALKNPYGAYYRKRGIKAPDNGFSSIERLREAANKLGYRAIQDNAYGYIRINPTEIISPSVKYKLDIKYPGKNAVSWLYDPASNFFVRNRGGLAEMDKNTKKQVEAANIIILKTTSRRLEGQYNDVRVMGRGEAIIYRAGQEIKATWEKNTNKISSRLRFLDEQDQEIPLAKGKIWLEYIDSMTSTSYIAVQ
ncbi:MAG: hypothetical protein UU22_C0040G0003 [Parcubacteria group bacterium GW2011_GWA2_40_8]|nr:MAG: hypothetical protein UU22_C0040G0003 [Parcubacteria group bacterium GW2011_GWA2_40_8]